MTTGMIDDNDEQLIERAREKCHRGEIDQEFLGMITRMKEVGLSPVLCDGGGDAIREGQQRKPGFTLRVSSLTCTKP